MTDTPPDAFRILLVDPEPATFDVLRRGLVADGIELARAGSLAEARQAIDDTRVDLTLIEPALPDGSGMQLAEELAGLKPRPETIVISGAPSLQRAVEAIRVGAADFLIKPIDLEALNQRVRGVIDKRNARQKRRARNRKLQRVAVKLSKARKKTTAQVDTLCNDLVTAYQELADQMQGVMHTQEYQGLVGRELDLERLLRRTLDFLLQKLGPTNAAVYLPGVSTELTIGGFVNFDCSQQQIDLLLPRLGEVVADAMDDEMTIAGWSDAESLNLLDHDLAEVMGPSTMLAFRAAHDGEMLALITLFRAEDEPFEASADELCLAIAPRFADHLARIVRIHHRHLPPFNDTIDGDAETDTDRDAA